MSTCTDCKRFPSAVSDSDTKVCPYRMSDGRMFTDYTPSCMSYTTGRQFKSSYDARQYYIHNATDLMKKNAQYSQCCSYTSHESGTMLPEKNMITCNGKTCSSEMVNKDGLGDGRKY